MRHLAAFAMLARMFAPDRTEQRRQLDAQIAEQRRLLAEERRAAQYAQKAAQAERKAQRAERRKLLLARVHDALVTQLANAKCGAFQLSTLVDHSTLVRFAANVTGIVARELDSD